MVNLYKNKEYRCIYDINSCWVLIVFSMEENVWFVIRDFSFCYIMLLFVWREVINIVDVVVYLNLLVGKFL